MVVKPNNMEKQVRSELKGGKGDIHFLNCVSKDTIPNCRLLGPIYIGDNCKVASNAVVLNSVPAGTTVAGMEKKSIRVCMNG